MPFPDVEVRVTDPDDPSRDVALGERGELLVHGPQVFSGYRGPAGGVGDGAPRVVPHRRHRDDVRGRLPHAGRPGQGGHITGGFNVYPSEVEAVLRTHPSVADAAVVGEPQPDGSEQVVAAVVVHEGHVLDAQNLRDHVRGSLTAYKVPKRVVALPELPRNQLGKVLRREVVPLVAAGRDDGQGSRAGSVESR